jgi:anti-sigma regulatory factor (Ser/Thr protein kinase)
MTETVRPILLLQHFPQTEEEQIVRDLGENYEIISADDLDTTPDVKVAAFRAHADTEKFFTAVEQFRQQYPDTPAGVVLPESQEVSLTRLSELSVINILPLQMALQYRSHQMNRMLYSLQYPAWGFGVKHLLPQDAAIERMQIKNREDKNAVQGEIEELLLSSQFDLSSINHVLVGLEETLNNGLFHAFRDDDGEEKYHLDTFTELNEEDQVTVEYSKVGSRFVFSVTDNAGSLAIDALIDRLTICDDPTKLLDERGRGLYIIRSLGTETVYNLWPDNMTQVILTIDSPPILTRSKPLFVNQYKAPPEG